MTKTESYTFRLSSLIRWSTQYGMGDQNSALDICTNEYYVWIAGMSNKDWTFEQFDPSPGSLDYFRELQDPNSDLPEATIARFDIPQIVGVQDIPFQNNNSSNNISIYPNPNDGRLTIDLRHTRFSGPIELCVINSLGQVAKSEQHSSNKGYIDCEMLDLAPGVYQLVLIGDGRITATSFVKN
jgi:Secretion system C-terminal sorting domain